MKFNETEKLSKKKDKKKNAKLKRKIKMKKNWKQLENIFLFFTPLLNGFPRHCRSVSEPHSRNAWYGTLIIVSKVNKLKVRHAYEVFFSRKAREVVYKEMQVVIVTNETNK